MKTSKKAAKKTKAKSAPKTKGGLSIHVGRGRPKKGEETGPTFPRSIRFPDTVWKKLEKRAKGCLLYTSDAADE